MVLLSFIKLYAHSNMIHTYTSRLPISPPLGLDRITPLRSNDTISAHVLQLSTHKYLIRFLKHVNVIVGIHVTLPVSVNGNFIDDYSPTYSTPFLLDMETTNCFKWSDFGSGQLHTCWYISDCCLGKTLALWDNWRCHKFLAFMIMCATTNLDL